MFMVSDRRRSANVVGRGVFMLKMDKARLFVGIVQNRYRQEKRKLRTVFYWTYSLTVSPTEAVRQRPMR